LVAPIVSLAVATRGGDIPRWLSEGVGAAIASRKGGPRDREAKLQKQAEMSEAFAAMDSAKKFLDNKMSPEHSDRIGAAIASSLLDRGYRRNFDTMLRNVSDGMGFEEAFTQAFRVPPEAFVGQWLKFARGG
jgi:hypothetical protein